MDDKKLFKWAALLLVLPIALAVFGGDTFRYPCQDPANWDNSICQKPVCDVTRTCPEHIFKGQRDPRLGPPTDQPKAVAATAATAPTLSRPQGVECK